MLYFTPERNYRLFPLAVLAGHLEKKVGETPMPNEFIVLIGTAATIGFVHTIIGPDHYLPFIVLSKARKWNKGKTSLITIFCGIGHVLSSIILGFVGIGLGIAIFKIESIESFRGEIAA